MVNLEKEDLVNLVIGIQPYYTDMEIPIIKRCGYWCGGFVDQWEWNKDALKNLSEDDLMWIYTAIKKGWERLKTTKKI